MIYELRRKIRHQVRKAVLRDRASERHVQAVSERIWPWPESRLILLISLFAILDYTSTYLVLDISGKAGVYEAGPLAGWALQTGGFGTLLLVDMAAVILLSGLAVTARHLCFRFGFRGYARAMFIALLMPYAIMAFAAAINNLIMTFL